MMFRKKVIELEVEDMPRIYDLIELHKRGVFSYFYGFYGGVNYKDETKKENK